MDAPWQSRAAGADSTGLREPYRDLRARVERSHDRARMLEARRRQQVERVLQLVRQRSFRQTK
jgi:hypothetical protein